MLQHAQPTHGRVRRAEEAPEQSCPPGAEIRSTPGRTAGRIGRVTEHPDPWPLRHLLLRTPRLELRPDDDAGLLELVDLAHGGCLPPL